MKKTKNRAKTQILTRFLTEPILLDGNETPWAPPVPTQAPPTRSTQHSHTTAPRPYMRKHVKQLSLCSIGSLGLSDKTPRTRASTQLMQPQRKLTRSKTQPVSSMSLKDIDNNITTLYRMSALSSINEEVDDMFDPFSLVNYEELDDHLMRLKARHKPEARISAKPVPIREENSDSKMSADVKKSRVPTILEKSKSISDFSILYSSQITPQKGAFGWCCSAPSAKRKEESISSIDTKGRL